MRSCKPKIWDICIKQDTNIKLHKLLSCLIQITYILSLQDLITIWSMVFLTHIYKFNTMLSVDEVLEMCMIKHIYFK